MVRRWSRQRRIGHTGTLDPLASGVLVLCLGQATRLVEYYQGHAKQYYAEIILGAATDTYDALGTVTASSPIPTLNQQQIDDLLHQFRGNVLQSPPAYSALKQEGESVHHKARRGETVVLAPRPVTFYQIDLVAWQPPQRICLRVRCSAGTYIRSLAHDLGLALGTHAYLDRLCREVAGPFPLAQAHSLAAIEQAAAQKRLGELLLPLGYGLAMPQIRLTPTLAQRFAFGQKVVLSTTLASTGAEGGVTNLLAQAVDEQNHFLGLLNCLGAAANPAEGLVWKAEKWFAERAE
jgi:tRNA pseudouridine55 synthase